MPAVCKMASLWGLFWSSPGQLAFLAIVLSGPQLFPSFMLFLMSCTSPLSHNHMCGFWKVSCVSLCLLCYVFPILAGAAGPWCLAVSPVLVGRIRLFDPSPLPHCSSWCVALVYFVICCLWWWGLPVPGAQWDPLCWSGGAPHWVLLCCFTAARGVLGWLPLAPGAFQPPWYVFPLAAGAAHPWCLAGSPAPVERGHTLDPTRLPHCSSWCAALAPSHPGSLLAEPSTHAHLPVRHRTVFQVLPHRRACLLGLPTALLRLSFSSCSGLGAAIARCAPFRPPAAAAEGFSTGPLSTSRLPPRGSERTWLPSKAA